MSNCNSFNLLHKSVQSWIWKQGWLSLREIQEKAIPVILNGESDVIISASTASGKTEAAFLPVCSKLAQNKFDGIAALYISPLKALINDQYRRLESLFKCIDVELTPWHGDVLQSKKEKQKKTPNGVLLITPESLESLFFNQPTWCAKAFFSVQYIIIDEFHAFIGRERGIQLLSLLNRLEILVKRQIPRIALSATLGEIEKVVDNLRPLQAMFPCEIILSSSIGSNLSIQLRAYTNKLFTMNKQSNDEEEYSKNALSEIVDDLYRILRGGSHLVFANSRKLTEELSVSLSEKCIKNSVPNEFFPHHGSLSKTLRENLEKRLQEEKLPTTAVCTTTLELGIDIGSVDSIAQVASPNSVASLRQRLGRSGRRNNDSILRLFLIEEELTPSIHLRDRLRFELIQTVALISLLLEKKYEPPLEGQFHLSTLIQQTLSVIGQYGGVRADQLWKVLCGSGVFHLVDATQYATLLKALGKNHLLTQLEDGQLVLGYIGEKIVCRHTFYTAFVTSEEFKLEYEGRIIGSLPILSPMLKGQFIIFAGRRWKILEIYTTKKLITLEIAQRGKVPQFSSGGAVIHDIVRERMKEIYFTKSPPAYLNITAKKLFNEAIECFNNVGLHNSNILFIENACYLFPWLGDRVTNTIAMLLEGVGLKANNYGGIIEIADINEKKFHVAIQKLFSQKLPTNEELAYKVSIPLFNKFDEFVPPSLLNLAYAHSFFDVSNAINWLKKRL